MYCQVCNLHTLQCQCPDMDDRLESLKDNPSLVDMATRTLKLRKINKTMQDDKSTLPEC